MERSTRNLVLLKTHLLSIGKLWLNIKTYCSSLLLLLSSIILFINNTSAQVTPDYQWIWMKGDTIAGANYSIYGTQGVSNPANMPGSRGGAFGWQDDSGNFYLFGGGGYAANTSGSLSDLWKYNTATNEWTFLKGDTIPNQPGRYGIKGIPNIKNNPGGRYGTQCWRDTAGQLYLFGGYGRDANGHSGALNDLWRYDPITNEWTWLSGDTLNGTLSVYGQQGVPSSTNKPGARYSCFFWQEGGYFWLYGGTAKGKTQTGGSGEGEMNDLWRYNPKTNEWTWMQGGNIIKQPAVRGTMGTPDTANTPGGRGHGMAWENNGSLYLYGGMSYTGGSGNNQLERWGDLWRYDIANNTWTWINGSDLPDVTPNYGTKGIPAASNTPGARGLMPVGWKDQQNNFYLYGGEGKQGIYADLWKYATSTNEWTWLKGSNSPSRTASPGRYGIQGVADTNNYPGGREFGAVGWTHSFNQSQEELWLFGGRAKTTGQGNLNDLWRLSYDCGIEGGTLTKKTIDTVVCSAPFTLNGQVYNKNGTYTQELYTGCDTTLIVLTLSIEPIKAIINVGGFTLSTSQTFATYQWMLNGAIVSGATNRDYTVLQNGDYQVIVTNQAGCIDTSDIYTVNNYTSIEDLNTLAQSISIYPNPATDKITIQSPVQVNADLTDVSGRMIKQVNNAHQINVKGLASGLYLLKITDQDGRLIKVSKVVKREQ